MEGRDGDRGSVRNTALRETLEELNTAIAIRKETPLCLLQEVQTGFVQFVYLGCELFDSEYLKSNAEGKFTCVSFVNLADVLKGERRLVPTGEAAILMWLAMGAPGVDPDTRFSGRRPRQLFADICKERGASASQASARSD
ncbi:hypothetical protein C7H73_10630 [Pulveribacter suum]|uniref:Nudix hydrolase domain-containing protein n=2 Tax=Pulveribacter suum TaxID=2116657 RepID=A0A2P1NLZ3_9BURK|nr:hypothetical protein C7H73_10630 [Pulveribacter suum]